MTLELTLTEAKDEIVGSALTELDALQLEHYEAAGRGFTQERIEDLYDLVMHAIKDRDLGTVVGYAEGVAEGRFSAGFDVYEVQTVFNTLETLMWHRVVANTAPDDLAESIGLVSTVFGVAKDALARKYVSLAAHRHVTSLDLSALFRGASSTVPYVPEGS
jgi:hypothetical protein